MQLREITLDKGKCPLKFLEEQGGHVKLSWIFFSREVVQQLKKSAKFGVLNGKLIELDLGSEEEPPKMSLRILALGDDRHVEWYELVEANISEVQFTIPANAPEEIYFIRTRE